MTRFAVLVAVAVAAFGTAGSAHARWKPPVGTTWQWQLDRPLDVSVDAAVYDVDAFETKARQAAHLHRLGRHVVC